MGELHLEVLVERMRPEFRVEANIGGRRWPTGDVGAGEKGRVHHKKQTGGAAVRAGDHKLEPTAATAVLRVREQIRSGVSPGVHPVGGRGCQEAAEFGVLAGYPMSTSR